MLISGVIEEDVDVDLLNTLVHLKSILYTLEMKMVA